MLSRQLERKRKLESELFGTWHNWKAISYDTYDTPQLGHQLLKFY